MDIMPSSLPASSSLAVFGDIMHSCLPASPVFAVASLCAAISDNGGGQDRISALADVVLRNVVSRLPVKDGAGAACGATPLVLDDAHLQAEGPGVDCRAPAAAAVSRVLASHPGPFRWVHLVTSLIGESKGVENLVLVNRPWFYTVPVQLPPSLRRLYLGVWLFPFTGDGPPRGPVSASGHIMSSDNDT